MSMWTASWEQIPPLPEIWENGQEHPAVSLEVMVYDIGERVWFGSAGLHRRRGRQQLNFGLVLPAGPVEPASEIPGYLPQHLEPPLIWGIVGKSC
jgi:hypothetical protein